MQKKILLADQDEAYICYLEKKFIDEFGDGADVHVITKPAYMRQFFSTQQSFDVVVVSEGLHMPEFGRHNIGALFVLCEEEEAARARPNGLYKYMGIGDIFAPILFETGMVKNREQRKTKVVLLYSPLGGIGQTTLATGICVTLAKQFQRTLFMGLDSLQTSGYFIPQHSALPVAAEQSVQNKSVYVFRAIKPLIVTGLYDTLPPFQHPLEIAGILMENILHLVKAIKESEEYDTIVLDADKFFSAELTKLMSMADQTVLLTAQDGYSVHRLKCLLNSIDCSDSRRFTLVCNRYDAQKENMLVGAEGIPACEYIVDDGDLHPCNTAYLAENKDIINLAQKIL